MFISQSGTTYVFRYATLGTVTSNNVSVTFAAGAYSYMNADGSTGTSAAATVSLVTPTYTIGGNSVATGDIGYLDVRFTPTSGDTLNLTAILDAATAPFTLGGSGLGTIALVPFTTLAPLSLPGNVVRFYVTGAYATGPVNLTFAGSSFQSVTTANVTIGNLPTTLSFSVLQLSAVLANPVAGTNPDAVALNDRGYLDVAFTLPTYASSLDLTSMASLTPKFTVSVNNAADGTLNLDNSQPAILVAQSGNTYTFRFWYTGTFRSGGLTLNFIGGSFNYLDNNGATIPDFSDESLTVEQDNSGNLYISVPFGTSPGLSTPLLASWSPFTVTAITTGTTTAATSAVAVTPPTPAGSAAGVYNFDLTGGGLVAGEQVTIHFAAGTWSYGGTPSVAEPSSEALTIAPGQSESYIDVTYPLIGSSAINPATITGHEFTLGGAGAAGVAIGTNPLLVSQSASSETYRYFYTGNFVPGVVTVQFNAGSWADQAGDTGTASTQQFQVISQLAPPAAGQSTQQVFFIQISGELKLDVPGGPSPLLDITGEVTLTIGAGPVFTLDATGTVFVFKVGNVASGAAHFVLNTGAGFAVPELYGVLKLDTNFGFLLPYGITAQATAVLEVNTTSVIQTVQIALTGIPGDMLFNDPNTADVANLPQSIGGSAAFNQSIAMNLLALFQQNGIVLDDSATNTKDPAPTVTAEADNVTGSLMWIITSVKSGVTSRYYVRSIAADSSTGTSAHLEIDTEIQTFNLRPQTFLLQVSGQLTLMVTLPGQAKPSLFFSMRGAVQIQISNAGFQFFAFAKLDLTGSSLAKVALIAVNPALAALNFVDVTALFDIETQNPDPANDPQWIPGLAGYLKIDISLGTGNLGTGLNGLSPNVNFTGSFQLLFNTTLADLTYTIPNQFLNLLDPTSPTTIFVPGTPPQTQLFAVPEPNSNFPDANTLPTKVATAVALPANWVGFFSKSGVTLGMAPTVQLFSVDAQNNPYSWQVTDGSNIYYITKQYADPNNSGTSNELIVNANGNTPAIYIQLQIQGNLDLFNEINLVGSFTVTAQANQFYTSLSVAGNVTANVALLGTLSGSINFTAQVALPGAPAGTATGLWGSVSLNLAVGGIIPGVTMSRNFLLLVNASNEPQDLTNVYIQNPNDNPANPFDYILGTYHGFQPGIELEINGNITIGNLLTLTGEFNLTLQLAGPSPGITISVFAMLSMQPFGTLQAQGLLSVNSQGLFADISISLNSSFGSTVGISFSGSATLELNTSNTAQTYTVGGQNVTIQPGFLFTINGSVSFGQLASATGSATISITNQQFTISFNLTFELGSILVAASGFAGIYNDNTPGLALELNVSLNASIAQVVDINATGTLLLNTSSVVAHRQRVHSQSELAQFGAERQCEHSAGADVQRQLYDPGRRRTDTNRVVQCRRPSGYRYPHAG